MTLVVAAVPVWTGKPIGTALEQVHYSISINYCADVHCNGCKVDVIVDGPVAGLVS